MDAGVETIEVGTGAATRTIAVKRRSGGRPGLFWLGGFRSDMEGSKALALDAHGAERGLAVTRFDYSGHGVSGGRFEDGTISRWQEEAQAVFATTEGPQIVIGSSMGGWMALLLARAERARAGDASRLAGLVLVAPAPDFTEDLMWASLSERARRAILEEGAWQSPSDYDGGTFPITRALIEDGRSNLLLGGPIATGCPVAILQGKRDESVPWRHALRIAERLAFDDATVTFVDDGDHRLSRPQDIELLLRTADGAVSVFDKHANSESGARE